MPKPTDAEKPARYEWAWVSGEMTLPQVLLVFEEELQFCGCGMPEAAIQFVLDVLETYSDASDYDGSVVLCNYDKLTALLPDDGIRYFVLYQIDRCGLIEHGGSVPGWLTDKGVALRGSMRAFGAETISSHCLDYLTGEAFLNP